MTRSRRITSTIFDQFVSLISMRSMAEQPDTFGMMAVAGGVSAAPEMGCHARSMLRQWATNAAASRGVVSLPRNKNGRGGQLEQKTCNPSR
jgi:hypothetical protein